MAAAATGLIAATALTAAQADSGMLNVVQGRSTSVEPSAASPAIISDSGAGLAFDRPAVRSTPAAKPSRTPIVQTAGKTPAIKSKAAAPKAAPGPSARAQTQVPLVAGQDASADLGQQKLRAPLTSVTISSPFGYRVNPLTGAAGEMHNGIDLTGACSTAVLAAGAGTVTEAGWSPYGGGNRIVIDHGNGLKSTYNHLESIAVSVGQVLAQGAPVGGVGTTGNSTGCHLHFEVMVTNQTVDPSAFI